MIRAVRRRLSERDTIDLLAIMFGLTVCIVLVAVTIGVLVMVLANRAGEAAGAVEQIGRVISSILFVLLGLIAGRAPRMQHPAEPETDPEQ